MAKRVPCNPFENLKDFKTLDALVSHILFSIKVTQIKIVLPGGFDVNRINDPELLLPVFDILVGDATFNYIIFKAPEIIAQMKDRIEKVNLNPVADDKLRLYNEIVRDLSKSYQYFNSMNPIRYMSTCKWLIAYTEFVEGKPQTTELEYPNSKIDLRDEHWNIIENSFIIRRHLAEELLYMLTSEIDMLKESLASTQYKWKGENKYEIYELLQAIISSKRVDYVKGDEYTFSHDFLKLMGLNGDKLAYYKDKVLSRKKRVQFLEKMEECLEQYRIPKSKSRLK